MDSGNYTFRCPHCETMNLPEAQYCGHCAKAIGDPTLERIRKRKMDFVMIGMEMDLGILDDCFQIVLKKMLHDELFIMRHPTAKEKEKAADLCKASEPKQRMRSNKKS